MTKVGPTGEFPRGRVSDDDEGGVNIGITVEDGTIFLNFGVSLRWIGLGPEEARALATELLSAAEKADGKVS